jgi:uncharacterized cupin superfamily protein
MREEGGRNSWSESPRACCALRASLEKRRWFSQRLNPSSRFRASALAEAGGLERVCVTIAWLPRGKESFAFHAHRYEEEWLYVLEGSGLSIMGDEEAPIGPGASSPFRRPRWHTCCATPARATSCI